MSGKGGGKGGGKGMKYIKQTPAFLQKMLGNNPEEEGIEAAIRKRGERENEDRSDNEDEKPQVVDEANAVLSKERRKQEAISAKKGMHIFKQASASERFQDSAFERVKAHEEAELRMEAEKRRREEQAQGASSSGAVAGAGEATEAGAPGKIVFNPKAKRAGDSGKERRKRMKDIAGVSRAGAVKNASLLSFDDE